MVELVVMQVHYWITILYFHDSSFLQLMSILTYKGMSCLLHRPLVLAKVTLLLLATLPISMYKLELKVLCSPICNSKIIIHSFFKFIVSGCQIWWFNYAVNFATFSVCLRVKLKVFFLSKNTFKKCLVIKSTYVGHSKEAEKTCF